MSARRFVRRAALLGAASIIAGSSIGAASILAFRDVPVATAAPVPADTLPACNAPTHDPDGMDLLYTGGTAAIDFQIRRCDYRRTGEACEEDQWCAVAVVNDTRDFPGYAATTHYDEGDGYTNVPGVGMSATSVVR